METAAWQEGLFSVGQAWAAGFSRQLLGYHVRTGRFVRLGRGIYRLARFRGSGLAPFVELWLWSGREGVFSHATALAFHRLADLVTWPIYLTVPRAWRMRRLRVPRDLVLHYADIPMSERVWRGPVPVTTPRRTFDDGGIANVSVAGYREVLERARRETCLEPADYAYLERFLSFRERLRHSLRATF